MTYNIGLRTGLRRITGSIPPWVVGILIGLFAAIASGLIWPVKTIPITEYMEPTEITPLVELYLLLYHTSGLFLIGTLGVVLAYIAFRWDTMGPAKMWAAKKRIFPKIGKMLDVERQEEYKTLLTLATEMNNFNSRLSEFKNDMNYLRENITEQSVKNFRYATRMIKIVENFFESPSNIDQNLKGKNHIYALLEILDNMDDQLRKIKGYLQFSNDDIKVINQVWKEEIKNIESFFDEIIDYTRQENPNSADTLKKQYDKIKNEIEQIEERLENQAKSMAFDKHPESQDEAEFIKTNLGKINQEIQRIPVLYTSLLEIIYKLLDELNIANTIDSDSTNARVFSEPRSIFYPPKEKERKYLTILLLMKFVALSSYKEYEYIISLCRKIIGNGKLASDKEIKSDTPNKFELQQKLDLTTLLSFMHGYFHTIISTDKSDQFISRGSHHLVEIAKTTITRADTAQHAIKVQYTKTKKLLAEDVGMSGSTIQEFLHRKLPLTYPNSLKDKGDYLAYAKKQFNLLKHLREVRLDYDKTIAHTNYPTSKKVAFALAGMELLDPEAQDHQNDPLFFQDIILEIKREGMNYLKKSIQNQKALQELTSAGAQNYSGYDTYTVFDYIMYCLEKRFVYHDSIQNQIAQIIHVWRNRTMANQNKIGRILSVIESMLHEKYPRMN